uniref:Cytochrome c-553 n=1 Tax=Lophocladia kuetzingii TaxID=675577 RepID=A0A1Z1MP48_9FLOR|nr:cytochrome c553 [Lophocladia kuetzingii]ARW67555.1 cytochrome c553 [Lophocladia kuetzingii]
MQLLFNLFIVFFSTFLFSTQNISAQSLDFNAGKEIFSQNCTACHEGGQNVVVSEKNLSKNALEDNDMYSIDAIINQVTNGKGIMPAFGARLSDDDIQNVAQYVLNQAETSSW